MRHLLLLVLSVCLLVPASTARTQDAQQTITIPKSEFDALKQRVDQMEQEIRELKGNQAPVQPTVESAAPSETLPTASEPAPAPSAGGKHLLLPDISLIVQAGGKLPDDNRDPARQKLQLTEAEIGIQGYVYPNVKADAFVAASPAEGEAMQVEEAYLTYLGVKKGLNLSVGEKHVPFGRTNLLHNHSWLYTRQPLAISNLVASESLAGQGANLSYVIPTHGDLFAQLDLGTWANGSSGEQSDPPDIVAGPGANLTDRFSTARLWTSYPVTANSELELGGSWAGGKSVEDPDLGVDRVHLKGADLSYRHFWEGSRRLLLRGEGFWRDGSTDSNGDTAKGLYLFGNYRPNKYGSIGLLYDWSEFPQATNLHESALSLILTKQFSEQYYMRLQAVHGSRPDADSYNELWLQWVWGVGPHTHNLE